MSSFTGQLYQLESKKEYPLGSYVEVNGPHDRYGSIMQVTPQADGTFLNLIRGIRQRTDLKPVASF